MSLSEKDRTHDLQACPFCGCHGLSFAWPREFRGRMAAIIECHTDNCYALLTADSPDKAVAAWNRRAEGVAALQQAGEPEKNDALRAIMPFAEIGAASEIARFNAMHLPDDHSIAAYIGIDRVRAAMSAARDALSPLPQQTALVEGQSPELDDINGRLA